MQVHVQTEPTPDFALLLREVLVLPADERPNLIALKALAGQVAQRLVLIARTAAASSTSSLTTVFFATPVMRTVARMLLPSQSAATTATAWPWSACSY